MKLTIHGSGYVGLVTAACIASMGNRVLCIDIDKKRVQRLKAGKVPISEPGLDDIVEQQMAAGRLQFSDDPVAGVRHADLQFIAVGTPADEDGSADLSHVLAVACSIAQHMDGPRIIVNKSTVPVGTADRVRQLIGEVLAERGVGFSFDVISNPEFLKEGAAVQDFMKPDRIILGATEKASIDRMRALYQPFTRRQERMLVMPVRDAEFTKYAANTMLAARISMMNEFAGLAERLGVDIESVRRGIGMDPRIGPAFLYPGAGYGGSCLPKDVAALRRMAESVDYDAVMLAAADRINEQQKRIMFDKLHAYFDGNLNGKVIALWGLAFKPGTDDMREAPSRVLMEALWKEGATVRAFDPAAMGETRRIYGERKDLVLCGSRDDTLQGADALAIVTEWSEFRSPDLASIRQSLSRPVIVDGRNLYEPSVVKAAGLDYFAIGRRSTDD